MQGFPLRGSIALDNLTQIQQLMNHGASHKEVHVNMAGLQRIDFSATGVFVDALNKLAMAGKKVVLIDVSELVFPLLEVFGVNRIAVLLRRKAQ
jgi:anti-anti-sigma regulatory factor